MKKLLIGMVAMAALNTGSALAADIPVKAPPRAPEVYNWTGFYFGSHIGYAESDSDWTHNDHTAIGGVSPVERVSQNGRGPVSGGQVGYRQQWGTWVGGLELTGAWTRIKGHETACGNAGGVGALQCTNPVVNVAAPFSEYRLGDIRNIFTATVQLGMTWDRSLFYVKGGVAGARVNLDNLLLSTAAPPAPAAIGVPFSACGLQNNFPSCGQNRRTAWGGTAGIGVEYAFTSTISAGLEADWMAFRNDDAQTANTTGLVSTFRDYRSDVWQVVGRINYRLGAPVVARY